MKYDFTTIMDRKGKDAMAIDAIGKNEGRTIKPTLPKKDYSIIPMWIADMNFPTVPTIVDKIIDRAKHPAYGYFYASDEYYNCIVEWHKDRHGVTDLKKKHIGYENGVLGCISSAIAAFTLPGDSVLIHSPTYVGFSNVLKDTGRVAQLSPLKKDEQGVWRMDFKDMERRIKENNIHLVIFCSPHNPCGRVWEQWEIEKAMKLFQENEVIVVADEIWSDIVFEGHKHIPTYSVSEYAKKNTVSIYAPSKTFNLAGLIGSYHITFNKYLKDKMVKASSMTHYNQMNVFSMHSLIGAYCEEGKEWLGELNTVLQQNVEYVYNFINEEFEGVEVALPDGTYMMFLHCEDYCKKHGLTIEELVQRGWNVGVAWQNGTQFYDPWGIRINCAVPFSLIKEAMKRLKEEVFSL